MAPPPKPDLGRSAATAFMNVRQPSRTANPFVNARVGSSTGPRYVPPAVSASRHLEGLHNAPRPEASQAAMEDYRRSMSQLGMGAAGRPAFKKGGPVKAKPKAAAPVKKKAGGMIAKPKPAAPKAKGKAMPAFKKGGAVKAKGKR